ncbi:Type I secretion system, outer membrane component LapE [Caballeronia glathei]|uniref:Transporter n=2 Tax=Caballeronia glathei TaxID=60547 RepID=A0A069PSG3_9BURK|nr:TolC family protein [Caballeronia glathei]KDR42824.1 transporter [Caballeronia glathei]CDY74555.1 Type I secretion system, outer membrane component LapE [Caballeronia glathei]
MQKRKSAARNALSYERRAPDARGRGARLRGSGVLVGAGVMALACAPSRSQAASALDAMPWVPTHVPVTQPGAIAQPAAPVSASAGALPPATPERAAVSVDEVHRQADPSPALRAVAAPTTTESASADMRTVARPPQASSLAGAGEAARQLSAAAPEERNLAAVPSSAPVSPEKPVATRKSYYAFTPGLSLPESTSTVEQPSAKHFSSTAAGVQSPIARDSGATVQRTQAGPLPTSRLPKSGLGNSAAESLKSLASDPVVRGEDVTFAFPDAPVPAKKRAQRGSGAVEEAYSQWLGDSAIGVRDVAGGPPVPEQAVRSALRQAADLAAERSAEVRQARADWEAAGYDTDEAKGRRWPQVQIGGYSPSIRDSGTRYDDYNRAYANVNISTRVYDWGKTSKTIESRSRTADAAQYKYLATAQANAYDISSNLVELAKNRAAYAIGVNYVKRMRALVDMLVEIVKVDPGRSSELTQAKARLLQAQTTQDAVATRVRELELAVRKLVGDQPTPMPGGIHWQMRVAAVEDAVAAIAQNPTVAQAGAEQAAADAYAKAVRASGLPEVNWVITKSTGRDTFGSRQPWQTMLQLSWSPFQGGSQRASERAALARADSSGEKKEQLRLDAEYNVRQAHHDALALAERARLYAEVADESELVRKQFFEQWYHLGRRTLLDVLLAESDFYNNQVAEVTTQFDAYQSVLKLHLSSGTLMEWLNGT